MGRNTGTELGGERAEEAGERAAARYDAETGQARRQEAAAVESETEAGRAARQAARLTDRTRRTRLMWGQRLWAAWGLERPDRRDAGMVTSEYAVGLLAAVAFAGLLYKIVTGGAVRETLESLVTNALNV